MKLSCWTNIALTNGQGRKLTIYQNDDLSYLAILHFGDLDTSKISIGGHGKTPDEALEALESALTEDAANEMVEQGNV